MSPWPLRRSCHATNTPPAPSEATAGRLWSALAAHTRSPSAGQPAATPPAAATREAKITLVPNRQSCQARKAPDPPSAAIAG